jgi:hypothetical protein
MLAGVCCAAAVMCGDVSGMEIDTICISKREQFFQITEEEAKSVKSVYCENQDIDYDFFSRFHFFTEHTLDSISFDYCSLDINALCVWSGISVSNLTITNCQLEARHAQQILSYINPYSIHSIDFSNNLLGNDEQLFDAILQRNVYGPMALSYFNLKNNGFTSDFIQNTIYYNREHSSNGIAMIEF